MANWAQLLPDLLTLIVRKVDIYEDFVAFGGVCRSWRSVAVKDNLNQKLAYSGPSSPSDLESAAVQPPWLMLAEKEEGQTYREFVSMARGGMVRRVELPEAEGKWCIGSYGWLITMDKEGGMELLHPLTRARVCLPHLSTFTFFEKDTRESGVLPIIYTYRAILSASPSTTDNYVVMLVVGLKSDLAFWKPGDKGWTLIQTSQYGGFYDVIYHKDKFYAISLNDDVIVCDVGGLQPTTELIGQIPEYVTRHDGQLHLVQCCDDLLIAKKVINFTDGCVYHTTAFEIYSAADSSMAKWLLVKDLGGTSIFVGHNTAIAVPRAAALGLKPNCVYFTDDYVDAYVSADDIVGGKDMGIFNLASGEIDPLIKGTSLSRYCPPMWVSPSF